MKKAIYYLLPVFLLIFSFCQLNAQLNPRVLAKTDYNNLKNIKALYMVVKDINSPIAQKNFKVLKENWKICATVELISEKDVSSKTDRSNLFLSSYKAVQSITGEPLAMLGYHFWCFSKAALNDPAGLAEKSKKKGVFYNSDESIDEYDREIIQIPKAKLIQMREHDSNEYEFLSMDEKKFNLWGEGVFKNRLQAFQILIREFVQKDNLDEKAIHLVAYENAQPVSTARMIIVQDKCFFGRIA